MKHAVWILWPSFVVGGIAEMVFFTAFDPAVWLASADDAGYTRTAVYTVGFFLFWTFAAASSAFTCFLQRTSAQVNRLCPLEPEERPIGCPKRAEPT